MNKQTDDMAYRRYLDFLKIYLNLRLAADYLCEKENIKIKRMLILCEMECEFYR